MPIGRTRKWREGFAFFQIYRIMREIAGSLLRYKAVHHAAQNPLPVHPALIGDRIALLDLHGRLGGHGCGGSQRSIGIFIMSW